MFIRALIFCTTSALIYRLYTSCVNFGLYNHVYNHRPGECRIVPGFDDGSEDMVQLSDGTVIVSHGLDMHPDKVEETPTVKGEFSMFNLSNPEEGSKKLKVVKKSGLELDIERMRPHGLGHYKDGNNDYIYVVNHSPRGDVIEKFKYTASELMLEHVKTYEDALFAGHNDVLVIGPDSFYTTIASRLGGMFLLMSVELLIGVPTGRTILYEGGQARSVADGLLMNGINMSPDGRYVYIAKMTPTLGFGIYERLTNNDLKLVSHQHIGNAVDNIEVLPNGDIVLGSLVSLIETFKKLKSRHLAKAPSQVLYVKMADSGRSVETITSLLGDDGTMVDGASIATVYKNNLLIGTFHEKMIYCKIAVPYD